jgi:hypothetical protein
MSLTRGCNATDEFDSSIGPINVHTSTHTAFKTSAEILSIIVNDEPSYAMLQTINFNNVVIKTGMPCANQSK